MANTVENQKKWLEELGWSHEAVEEVCRKIGTVNVQVPWQEAKLFGSELFKELWKLDICFPNVSADLFHCLM